MNQPLFTYNQEQAASVGAGQYVTKSAGYDVKVVRAVLTKSQTQGSQAQFLEMDLIYISRPISSDEKYYLNLDNKEKLK